MKVLTERQVETIVSGRRRDGWPITVEDMLRRVEAATIRAMLKKGYRQAPTTAAKET